MRIEELGRDHLAQEASEQKLTQPNGFWVHVEVLMALPSKSFEACIHA